MPKLSSRYPRETYRKDYYNDNKEKYLKKSQRVYQYFIVIDGVKHIFQKKKEIVDLIGRELITSV